jgi:predicted kinase
LGKSTWIRKYYPDATVISMDEIRRELTGSVTDQSQNRKVFQRAQERLKRLLTTSQKIVWDATNIREIHRSKLTTLAYQYRAFVRIDVLCAPLRVALTRNRERERQVPKEIITHQYQRWEWPTADEAHEIGYWFLDQRGEWCLA